MADGLGLVAVGRVVELIDHILLRAAATWVRREELSSGPLLVSRLLVLPGAALLRHLASCLVTDAAVAIYSEGRVLRKRVVAWILDATVGVHFSRLTFDQVVLVDVACGLFARRLRASSSVALAHHL